MTVAIKVRSAIERSSWIRRMFEEGAALIAEYGAELSKLKLVETENNFVEYFGGKQPY